MDELGNFIKKVNDAIINPIIALLFALALVYFLWGVFEFIRKPEEREKGRNHMVWGIVGMFIMISVFGIMRLIANTLGLDTSVIPR